MITTENDPPSYSALIEPIEPAQAPIALNVTVRGRTGERSYWMSEGGRLFFRGLDGQLHRANEVQAARILRGLELARRSDAFEVTGRIAQAGELDIARGLAIA